MLLLPLLWLSATYPETAIQVDLSSLFIEESDVTAEIQRDDFEEIYPGVARVLHDAGVPLVEPSSDIEGTLLDNAGISTVEAPTSPTTLRLEFSSPNFVGGFYRIHVSVRRHDGSERALPPLTCGPNCLADNVEAFLRERQASILALLEAPSSGESSPARRCPGAPDCTETPPPPRTMDPPHGAPKLGPLGIVGAIGMGIGAGFLTWSGVSLGLERRADWNQNFIQDRRAHYANDGTYAVLGVGAFLLVSGIVMVVVDRVVLPKRRRPTPATSFQIRGASIRF